MKITKFLLSLVLIGGIMTGCNDSKNEKCNASSTDTTEAVINNIMTRTSVRRFTSQPIAKDTLDLIVKAGMAAPSAVDARPWAFVVVTDRPVLDSLNQVSDHYNLKTATAAIVVCGDLSKALKDDAQSYWVQDCSAVSENILLAAHAYGLGAVWCGAYPIQDRVKAISQVLGLPENIVPLNVITMGHPDPDEPTQPKDKFNPQNIHYQKW